MKNLSQIYFIVSLIVSLSSCNHRQDWNKYVKDIPETILKGKNINLGGIYQAHRMVMIDSLFIITSFNGDYFFHIYNLETHRLIKEFGSKGKGPDEFVSPRLFNGQRIGIEKDSVQLLIFDEGRRTLNKINILKILAGQKNAIKSEIIPEKMIKVSDIIFKNDTIAFYIPTSKQEGRFYLYNFNSKTLTFTQYLPDLGFKVHQNNVYPIYSTASACINEKRKRIVALPVLMGELDFFSFSGDYIGSSIIERIKEIEYAKNEKMIFKAPNMRYYISDIQSDDNRIYVLLTVKLYPDLKNKTTSDIYVFDWDGNPLEKYKLDREIHAFGHDEKNKRFIGYSVDDLEDPFIEYQYKINK